MLKVGIILGSTRPNRVSPAVGQWVLERAQTRADASYEIVDIADYNLPLLDEGIPPSLGKYTKEHTKTWAAKIASLDAFVFIAPEYNHGIPGALKNAIDFIYAEWNDKVAGFVSYGSAGGTRSVEHLRGVMAELQVADVRQQVAFNLATDFENYTTFKPAAFHDKNLETLLDQVVRWATALKTVRG